MLLQVITQHDCKGRYDQSAAQVIKGILLPNLNSCRYFAGELISFMESSLANDKNLEVLPSLAPSPPNPVNTAAAPRLTAAAGAASSSVGAASSSVGAASSRCCWSCLLALLLELPPPLLLLLPPQQLAACSSADGGVCSCSCSCSCSCYSETH